MAISEEFTAALHAALLEYYRLNGMDRPLRLNGGIQEPFHHSQCTCGKCLAEVSRALNKAVAKQAQGTVKATVLSVTPPAEARPIANPYGQLEVNVLPARRIGDEERNKILEQLQEMFVQGRLTQAELDARQEAALAAKVADELNFLVRDLPAPRIAKEPEPASATNSFLPVAGIMTLLMAVLAISLILATGAAAAPAIVLTVMTAVALIMTVIWRN